eukprot:TRINITY_DN2372_c0_g1_i3.p1 TRINITY_DN2372_c0_g1~~TRINITY_DN2372_c0_g1_i3.p1  ORF type:complete len:261 (-),score=72.22 TRINITY_DN2372_c0_g1_i3:49-831(-)
MSSLAAARAINSNVKLETPPVAIFVGGTSGIGQFMAQRMAHYIKGPAHIIISGRNAESAEKFIDSMKKENGEKTFEFVRCDVSSMKKIREFAVEVSKKVEKVNYLVVSSGCPSFEGRNETEEGIDMKLATHFYGRFLAIYKLLPLLNKAAENNEDTRVMTIFEAGGSKSFHPEDLELKHCYSLSAAADAGTLYNDLMVDKFSSMNPNIGFMHIFPGIVKTDAIQKFPWYARALAHMYTPFATSSDDCADYMLKGCSLIHI